MQIQENVLNDMLKNIADPKLREVYGSIISGKIVAQVKCLSEDIIEEQEVPLLGEKGEQLYYVRGDKKGQPKTEFKNVVVREGCKGRVIAYIDDKGKVDEVEPKLAPEGSIRLYSSGLEGVRQRFDGQLGFRCYCGNNSVLCEEEKGIISPARPSADDLAKIAKRLNKRNTNPYTPKNGKLNVDGFIVEEVKV